MENTTNPTVVTYHKTTEKLEVDNYPYGYKRTTAYFSLEFHPKKGFRTVFQTIDPKNGRLNKPKKSTYYELLVQYTNSDGHIKSIARSTWDYKDYQNFLNFVAEHFDLFTPEQIQYFYLLLITKSKVNMISAVQYCNSDLNTLKDLFKSGVDTLVKGAKEGGNLFSEVKFDWDAITATKDPSYQPFKVVTYEPQL